MGGFYSDELPDFFSKPKNYHFKSKLNYYPITQAAFLGETEVVSNLIGWGSGCSWGFGAYRTS